MDHSFDRNLKNKLEGQSPEELGHNLDRERLWQQISGKHAKRKTWAFPSWASHASAVAAGLLVGVLLLSRHKDPQAPAVVRSLPAAQATKVIVDTVYLPQTAPAAPVSTVAGNRTPPQVTHQPLPSPAQKTDQTSQEEPAPAAHPETEVPVIAAAAPQQPKVMYLSDMDNENAIPKRAAKRPFIVLSNQNQPGNSSTETLVAQVYRKIIPIKN